MFTFLCYSTKLHSGVCRQNRLNTSNIHTSSYLLLWNSQWLSGSRCR